MKLKTHSHQIKGEGRAVDVAGQLTRSSIWFTLTPLPDDLWQFTVKSEEASRLAAAVTQSEYQNSDEAKAYRETAKRDYNRDGETEIDDGAIVSKGEDDGAYVAAWVWVADVDAGLDTGMECSHEGCTVRVHEEDPYFATPCGTYCSEHMHAHVKDCEICRNEFDELANDGPPRFTNYYLCQGNHEHSKTHAPVQWTDQWSAQCDDRCPECDVEIEPYASVEHDDETHTGGGVGLLVPRDWKPERLPEGCETVEDLDGWPS